MLFPGHFNELCQESSKCLTLFIFVFRLSIGLNVEIKLKQASTLKGRDKPEKEQKY